MFFSVLLGALLYIVIQFLWYSPFGFGQHWLALKKGTLDLATEGGSNLRGVPASIQHLIFPALLMSVALHTLAVVLARFGTIVFFVGVGLMFLSTVAWKYTGWSKTESSTRLQWYVTDGALLASLVTLALFVTLAQGRVY